MSSLELYLVTFNCARTLVAPPAFAPSFFDGLPKSTTLPDIIAVSLQELAPISYGFLGGSSLSPYFGRIEASIRLAVHHSDGDATRYENVFTKNNGMTALMVFAKEHVVPQITSIQSAETGVGFWDMGNKGAVGARLRFKHASEGEELDVTFVAAHLAPMESAVERRNQDWETVVRNLVFTDQEGEQIGSASSPKDGSDLQGLYHTRGHVFFCGDLNYRTSDIKPEPEAHWTYPKPDEPDTSNLHFSRLLKDDQLTRELQANRTLHGFEELPITFPPTYKLSHEPSSSKPSNWQWAKHRFPSWCDRCLYLPPPKSASPLQLRKYTSLAVQATSDHAPVALSVSVPLEAWDDTDTDDIRRNPPFEINPHWRSRLEASRRYEIATGVMAYLTTTNEGIMLFVTTIGGAAAIAYFFGAYFG